MLRIFAGHDPLQPVSTTVLVHSIISRASKPVCVNATVSKNTANQAAGAH